MTKVLSELPANPPESSSKAPPKGSGYVPTLDGWRAIAILMVLVAHGRYIFATDGITPEAHLFRWANYGDYGVDVFFGISGLLICGRLLQEKRIKGEISLKEFYIRRIFRILPAACAFLGVLGILTSVGALAVTKGELLSSIFFFRNYLPDAGPDSWYTGHYWSLAIEEHFYLFVPLLMKLFSRRQILWLTSAIAVAVAFWRTIDSRWNILTPLIPNILADHRTDHRLDALMWGCWLAALLADEDWRIRISQWLSFKKPLVYFAGLFLFASAILIHTLVAVEWRQLIGWSLLAFLMPFMLTATVLYPTAIVSKLLELPLLKWVGRLSYSLYLWQQLFIVPTLFHRPLGWLQSFPLQFAAVFLMACASYYLIERPMIRWGHRLARPAIPGR